MGRLEDEDIKWERASINLLANLGTSLDKALWKKFAGHGGKRRAHRYVRARDLSRIVSLVCPLCDLQAFY